MSNVFAGFYLKVKLIHPNAKLPTRGTPESAGLDFYTPTPVTIPVDGSVTVPLGMILEMPPGFLLFLENKSGISTKKTLIRGANIIDSDYRGEPHVNLINLSGKVQYFDEGQKIIQGLIMPAWLGLPIEVKDINLNTERGSGGFGSTGQ